MIPALFSKTLGTLMAEPTTLISDLTASIPMKSFHCDTLELRIQFEIGGLDVDAFLSAVDELGISTESDEDGDREIILIFASESNPDDYHAHLTVRVWKDGSGRTEIGYYSGGTETAVDGVSAENCAQWMGKFFASEVTAHVHINYTFDKSFKPTVNLNFPAPTTEKALAGSIVSGLALIFPTYPGTTAVVQAGENDETYIFLRKTVKAGLTTFRVTEELENTSELVSSLIRKSE